MSTYLNSIIHSLHSFIVLRRRRTRHVHSSITSHLDLSLPTPLPLHTSQKFHLGTNRPKITPKRTVPNSIRRDLLQILRRLKRAPLRHLRLQRPQLHKLIYTLPNMHASDIVQELLLHALSQHLGLLLVGGVCRHNERRVGCDAAQDFADKVATVEVGGAAG